MDEQDHSSEVPVSAQESLARTGWAVIPAASDRLLNISNALGSPVPSRPGQDLIDTLTPTDAESAHPRSLSVGYGKGPYPFHTDAANWATPCRYVVLSCPGVRQLPTLLLPWKTLLSEADKLGLAAAVFFVRNGAASFYTTAFDRQRGFLRYDPGCMRPATPDSVRVVEGLQRSFRLARPELHMWGTGDVLLIDNWRVLHARPAWTDPAGQLNRVMVAA